MSFSFYCYVCDKEYHRERDYRTHKDTKRHISCYEKIGFDRCGITENILFIMNSQEATPILKEKAEALTDILADEIDVLKFRNSLFQFRNSYDPVAEESHRTNARKIQSDIAAFCEKYAVSNFKCEFVLPSIIEMINSGMRRGR